jgi:hypothetical protein
MRSISALTFFLALSLGVAAPEVLLRGAQIFSAAEALQLQAVTEGNHLGENARGKRYLQGGDPVFPTDPNERPLESDEEATKEELNLFIEGPVAKGSAVLFAMVAIVSLQSAVCASFLLFTLSRISFF